jgi:HAD superfamily hydrolase (TIGR01484 family)
MRYFCLTCDYDGTIARHGEVSPSTIAALKRARASGRKLILATGRHVDDLLSIFPDLSIFDRVVAENGAVLYRPATREREKLAEPPPPEFVEELRRRAVEPLSVGECIVATWHPFESTVLDVIRSLGLELQIVFNKHAVMVLPSGVNKGTGVQVALDELGLSPHNMVGIGDAENDHAFLRMSECSVAVANALPSLKERADIVTSGSYGTGVEEFIKSLLSDDLQSVAPRLSRHWILLGRTVDNRPFYLEPYGTSWIVAGPSGAGKSTLVLAIVERLIKGKYQVCLIDPEGDYEELGQFVTLGGPDRVPGVSEVSEVLKYNGISLAVNLLGVQIHDRPSFFQRLLPRIQELRSQTGRPHWLIIDEAHHPLPSTLDSARLLIPKELTSFALITVQPDHVSRDILNSVNGLIMVGPDPAQIVRQFNAAARKRLNVSDLPQQPLRRGQAIVWSLSGDQKPLIVTVDPAKIELRRHRRKYAVGELGEDKSFYFRGPDGKLNLRAQNMNTFAQLAQGVDDDTWNHHLRQTDYSRWLRESVKDDEIAAEVQRIEQEQNLSPAESRSRVIDAIRKHYTAPA